LKVSIDKKDDNDRKNRVVKVEYKKVD